MNSFFKIFAFKLFANAKVLLFAIFFVLSATVFTEVFAVLKGFAILLGFTITFEVCKYFKVFVT